MEGEIEEEFCDKCTGAGYLFYTADAPIKLCDQCEGSGMIKVFYTDSIIHLESERFLWSQQTFPEATSLSSLAHLASEIKEIEESIVEGSPDVREFADAQMLLFDAAQRSGISVQMIFDAFKEKLEENKLRKWEMNKDGYFSHVKE